MRAKFGVLEQTQGLHLQAKFHLNVLNNFYSPRQVALYWLYRLPVVKDHNCGQILTFWGLLYQAPYTDEGKIWCAIADPRYTFTCEISSRSVYSVVLWRWKPPIFAVFWTSSFSDVANWHQSQKVEHACTTTNLPLSNGLKIVSVLQRLHGEIWRTNCDVQKRDRQTDKQTNSQKNSTFLATLVAGEIRAPPNLAWW